MATHENTQPRPPGDDQRPGRSSATLFVSALVIGLVVILGAFLTYTFTITTGPDDPTAAAPPESTATTTTTTVAPPPLGSTSTLTSAPTGTRWELYQGVALPYSPTHGPTTVDGLGVATGYTHDATGALFAAAQIDTRRSLSPDATWRTVVEQQVASGQGRDTWIANRSTISIAPDSIPSSRLVQVAGFKVSNYTDTVAVISIARKSATGGFQAGDLTVTWVDGDWRLVLLPDGNSAAVYPLNDLASNSFITWAGV